MRRGAAGWLERRGWVVLAVGVGAFVGVCVWISVDIARLARECEMRGGTIFQGQCVRFTGSQPVPLR